jgi:LysM repeat protein
MLRVIITISLLIGPMVLPASRTTQKTIPPKSYTVQSGDSLSAIARKLHTTVAALRKANGLEEGALLHPGQKLLLPRNATPNASSKGNKTVTKKKTETAKKRVTKAKKGSSGLQIYEVRAGDTLSTIAREKGVSVKDLLETNRMKPGSLIRVGQTLVIPDKRKEHAKKTGKTTPKGKKSAGKAKSKTPGTRQSKKGVHVVRYGDTLFSIARQYHTPLKDLMALNGIAPTDVIHPEQELKIPGSSYRAKGGKSEPSRQKRAKSGKEKNAAPILYTVKHGDTLWEIAKKHKVSVGQIRRLNKMKQTDVIRSGMKLVIREGSRPAKAAAKRQNVKKIEKHYTVKKGDTLWEIARRHKTSVSELRRLNKMERKDVIRIGMKLTVGYEKVPPTRLAKTVKKKRKTTKKAAAKRKTKIAKASAKKKRSGKKKRRNADTRISNALAALNGKGSGRRGGSGGGDYNVIRTAKKYLGRRYVWGAEGPSSFDCSGFTQYVMRKTKGVRLPRVSRKQAYYGKYVTRSQLRPGDLVFFDTSRRRRGYVNHVGIYIGNGKFIHASSARHRVVITSLNSPFYRARFKWGRRVN